MIYNFLFFHLSIGPKEETLDSVFFFYVRLLGLYFII